MKLRVNITFVYTNDFRNTSFLCCPLSRVDKILGPFVVTIHREESNSPDRVVEKTSTSITYMGYEDLIIEKILGMERFRKDIEIELVYNELAINNRATK
jgi:hypothetical protein